MPIENQSKIIAEQLVADLRAHRRDKISPADVRRAVEGRVDGIGYYDRARVDLSAHLIIRRILEDV